MNNLRRTSMIFVVLTSHVITNLSIVCLAWLFKYQSHSQAQRLGLHMHFFILMWF